MEAKGIAAQGRFPPGFPEKGLLLNRPIQITDLHED
jgi:hypothetical protein